MVRPPAESGGDGDRHGLGVLWEGPVSGIRLNWLAVAARRLDKRSTAVPDCPDGTDLGVVRTGRRQAADRVDAASLRWR